MDLELPDFFHPSRQLPKFVKAGFFLNWFLFGRFLLRMDRFALQRFSLTFFSSIGKLAVQMMTTITTRTTPKSIIKTTHFTGEPFLNEIRRRFYAKRQLHPLSCSFQNILYRFILLLNSFGLWVTLQPSLRLSSQIANTPLCDNNKKRDHDVKNLLQRREATRSIGGKKGTSSSARWWRWWSTSSSTCH